MKFSNKLILVFLVVLLNHLVVAAQENEQQPQVSNVNGLALKKSVQKYVNAFGEFFQTAKDKELQEKVDAVLESKALKSEQQDIEISNPNAPTSPSPDSVYVLQTKKRVFGFHPKWSNNKVSPETYDYGSLTDFSFFSYKVDSLDVSLNSLKKSPQVQFIDKALEEELDVHITITNLNRKENDKFFANPNGYSESINKILGLVEAHKAHGVIIDFEDVSPDDEKEFTKYVYALSKKLNATKKKLTVAVPGNPSDAYNVEALDSMVNYFLVMGKNYFFKGSSLAGPVAPLNEFPGTNTGSLVKTIKKYKGLKMSPEKMILSLPYYGFLWRTPSDSILAKNIKLVDNWSYDEVNNFLTDKIPKYEPITQSKYYVTKETDTSYYQLWFDDARTLNKKYQLINNNDLGGVGLWALSYDSKNELNHLLKESFKEQWVLKKRETKEKLSWITVFKNLGALRGILKLGSIVFILGFMLSLRNAEIRAIVFQNTVLKNLILFGLPLFISIGVYFYSSYNTSWALVTLACILFGYGLYYLLVRADKNLKNINRIP